MSYATSLYLTAAEIGLSITALVLLLLAAWNGDRSARLLTIIRNHVQRVNGIISDVLDLSRRPRGQAARFPVATALEELAAGW